MIGGQASFLQSLGWAVLNSLWQLALLWVIYQVVTGINRKQRSSARATLASSFLIGGFAWFLFTFFSALGNPSVETAIGSSPLVNAEANPAFNSWLQQTLPIASIIYLVLLVFPILHFTRNYRYVQVIRKYGLTKMEVNWRIFVERIAGQMGIRRRVKIWVSELVSSPVTIGFLKPVILVPLAAINHLTPQQLEAVLLHELAHIRRFDYLVNLLVNFIQTILYFNPFARAFVKIVEKEREKSCDEMVLQFQYDSHEYASALLTLEKANHAPQAFAVSAAGKKNDLLSRIELIMGVKKKPVFSFNKVAGFFAGLLCVIALNAFLLLSKPVTGNRSALLASISNLSGLIGKHTAPVPAAEQAGIIVNAIAPAKRSVPRAEEPVAPADYVMSNFNDNDAENLAQGLRLAGFESLAEIPVLKKYQEEQVLKAVEVSKKVIENKQWKALERSIADVFTQKEKEQLKASMHKEIEAVNWEEWENRLRLEYDKVDWENVQSQLYNAANQVRLDSIQKVYNQAALTLNEVYTELLANNLPGIPDSDFSLEKIEQKKSEVQKVLNRLKSARTKKIVHL